MAELCAPYDLEHLTEFCQTALKKTGSRVYYIEGDYKMTNPETCVPVYLGRSIEQAAKALKRFQRNMQRNCPHLFSERIEPETHKGRRFRCSDCGKETKALRGIVRTHVLAQTFYAA